MAGHSQYKNIMHRKGRQDAAKAKLFSKLAREITVVCQARHARSRHERAPAPRHPGGARREHAQGQHRASDQEGGGRRCRRLRGDPLRGLCAGRRRGDRGSADRQPQPHGRRGACGVHQVRRQPRRRPGRSRTCSCTWARSRIRRGAGTADAVLEAAIDAGADDVRLRCRRPRHRLRLRQPRHGGRARSRRSSASRAASRRCGNPSCRRRSTRRRPRAS